MKFLIRLLMMAGLAMVPAQFSFAQPIVINEIMYHPSSENVHEEYIELFNRSSTNVNLSGWQLKKGLQFTFPTNIVIRSSNYLVVAADRQVFTNKYPTITNVIGNWLVFQVTNVLGASFTNYESTLSNTRNTIQLTDANGDTVDDVTYADEGDWAIRQRGLLSSNHRGWTWKAEHDGLGKSLELMNPNLPNEHGQNWSSSLTSQGTPGRVNSVASANIAPMILDVRHFPTIPKSTETVSISARIVNEASNVTVALKYRIDSASPPAFNTMNMFDDGQHGDGAAGDGIYGALVPAQANNTIIEFYIQANDAQNHARTWPGPALDAEDLGAGQLGQVANAYYQVDDSTYTGTRPLFKIILSTSEYQELSNIFNGSPDSDAEMNMTFISIDGTETLVRYLCGTRNRGHGSRFGTPHNYHLDFVNDNKWKGKGKLNLNARSVHSQHLGSVVALRAGAVGGSSQPVQLRVNNGVGPGGTPTYGVYAANEQVESDWADIHFPEDSKGNVYRAVRDLAPPNFDYRTVETLPSGTYNNYGSDVHDFVNFGPEDQNTYTNTFFKDSNKSEDDWRDLIGMLRVMGVNGTTPFTSDNVRQVVNVEQWLTHLAVMSFFNNRESGLNTGYNDDYYMYRGGLDPRFILVFHDLDTVMGEGDTAGSTSSSIFTAAADNGSGQAFGRFLNDPEFEPIYYSILQRLVDTTFSPEQFNPLADQTLGDYVPASVITRMKNWVAARRSAIQGMINGLVPAKADIATITGEPRSPTPVTSATLNIGGTNIVAYKYRLNNGAFGPETPVGTSISLSGLLNGSSNIVRVIGKNTAGIWQDVNTPTISRSWVVNTSWPRVRISEVLARNETAVNYNGTFPDLIELFNEGATTLDLSGFRLTDDPSNTNKFVFPAGAILPANGYLVLYANDPDGTPGLHLGFSLDQNGEGVYLYHRAASGGALLDSVVFGPQVANLSVGRVNGGTWQLTQPTFGAANVAQGTANPGGVKINEWLAAPQAPFADDFIELFNPGNLPVNLGGLFLTDNPIGAPFLHTLSPLSFVPANGYLVLTADGNTSAGANHVGFSLSSEIGEIALLTDRQETIDCVVYASQRSGVSQGRCPDGGSKIVSLVTPTPGADNLCPATPPPPITLGLIVYTNLWKYNQTSNYDGVAWPQTSFNDSAWPSGRGVLAKIGTSGGVPQPINTTLTLGANTYYFRTTFNVPAGANISSLQLYHYIDDGAVIYLNGKEAYRYNLPGGAITYSTLAPNPIGAPSEIGPITLPMTNLVTGVNLIAVEVHQNSSTSSDVFMGLKLDGIIITNSPTVAGLVINEVFANNSSFKEPDGSTPDWVELYNPSSSAVDLSDMSLSDTTLNPRRWVFPAGAFVAPQSYYTIRFDSDLLPSATNTGFGFKSTGDALYLFDKQSNGGGVLDFVTFGLQVADLSIGRIPNGGTNWNLTLPTIGAANLSAPQGNPGLLKINEWMADPAPGVDDWFEVYNPDPLPVSVGRFYLTDSLSEPTKYAPIPALSFIGSGSNAWQVFMADGNVAAGADHVAFSLKAAGEAVGMANAAGLQIDGVSFGLQQTGVSQGRLPDGAANIVSFVTTSSPGDPNYLLLTNVFINEVLTHTDPPLEDAVELYNPVGGANLNIGGWYLSDSKSNLRKYTIPAGTTVPGRGFKVFYEYQFNNGDTGVPFSFNSAKGDNVYLSQATNGQMTGYRAIAKFGPSENGVSFGRYVNTIGDVDYPAMNGLSFGTSVTAQSPTNQLSVFRTGQGATNPYPRIGPIVISEIMYHPLPIGTNDNVVEEFIELYNPTASSVPLYDPSFPTNTWRLRDAVDFDFPLNTSIASGKYLLIVSFDPATNASALATFRAKYGTNSTLVGPYLGKLDNGGESVELYKPDPPQTTGPDIGLVPYVLVDKVKYSDTGAWPTNADGFGMSLQRRTMNAYGNEPTNWLAATPSPGPGSGSNPSQDTDGDGMPDDYEMANGLNKNSAADASQDLDNDGMTNLQEYLAGTDPRNANSVLRLVPTRNGSNVELRYFAISGKTYTVQFCNALAIPPSWQKLTNFAASASNQTNLLTVPASGAQRFYRVISPAAP